MSKLKETFGKVKNKAVEVGGNLGDVVAETGKKVKESKVADSVFAGIKTGVDATAKGVKAGAARVKEGVGNIGTEKKESLDDQLRKAVDEYNSTYTALNDSGTKLFMQRQRALDLLQNVENLVNSIANHPKTFDKDFAEIKVKKEEFQEVCDFAEKELEAAKQSAMGVGAGVAGGMVVASLAPSAAMWIATTFGTASTGAAISTLSGAAATNAALAWLGGGALTAGGGGMVAGEAFLALTGPIGWGIAGATILTSIVLFGGSKMKINKDKKAEVEAVLANTERLKEITAKIGAILDQTTSLRDNLSNQYNMAVSNFGKNFMSIPEDSQMLLGTLVNNAKSLAVTLGEGV